MDEVTITADVADGQIKRSGKAAMYVVYDGEECHFGLAGSTNGIELACMLGEMTKSVMGLLTSQFATDRPIARELVASVMACALSEGDE